MARKTVTTVELTDDIDGSPAAETVAFAIDGVDYEIDLSDVNADEFRRSLEQYMVRARRVRRSGAGARRAVRGGVARLDGRGGGAENPAAVRAWALENGFELSARGRIPSSVIRAYEDAHS